MNAEQPAPRARRHSTPLHQLGVVPRAQWRLAADASTAAAAAVDPRVQAQQQSPQRPILRLRAQFLEAATQYKMIEILERKQCVLNAKEWEIAMEEFLRGMSPDTPYSPVDLELQMEKFLRAVLEKHQHVVLANGQRRY